MTLENQDIIQKSKNPKDAYPLISVGVVIVVGSMSNLMSRGVCRFFSQIRQFFHYIASCQLRVKDEHRVLVKGFELSQTRKKMVSIN